jgi:type II restriction/modification system DNA methylase subunit YeeA
MLEIRFDGSSDNAPRYIEFSKNRRGTVNKKLYFTLDKQNDVNYLEDKWHAEEENRQRMESELETLQKEAEEFDRLLFDGEEAEEVNNEVEETVAAV